MAPSRHPTYPLNQEQHHHPTQHHHQPHHHPQHRTTTQTSLERKLELLEARFTMPPSTPPPSAAATAQQQQQQQQNQILMSNATATAFTSPTVDEASSVATLEPLSSPRTCNTGEHSQYSQQQTQTHSQHSFGFDTPSLSTTTAAAAAAAVQPYNNNNDNATSSQLSNNNTSLMLQVGAITKRSRSPTNNFCLVQAAAAKHMAKVAEAAAGACNNNNNNNPNQSHQTTGENSLLLMSSSSTSSSSAATLLTGHVQTQSQSQLQQQQTVVQESPVVVEQQQQQKTLKKRKSSIPIKRNAASVQEAGATSAAASASAAATIMVGTKNNSMTDNATNKNTNNMDATIAAAAAAPPPPSKRSRSSNNNNNHNNSRSSNNKNIRATAKTTTTSTSPPSKRTIFPNHTSVAATSASTKPHKAKKDRSLYDFFSKTRTTTTSYATATATAMSTNVVSTNANAKASGAVNEDYNKSTATAATAATGDTVLQTPPPGTTNKNDENMVNNSAFAAAAAAANNNNNNNNNKNNSRDYWKTRCVELETALEEQQAQLAAVSNNRTILHTALTANLKKTQQQLQATQQEQLQFQLAAQRVMEDLIRQEATRQAVETREQLAANGARLGRIVQVPRRGISGAAASSYMRGMMSHVVEQWEEGHAWLQHQQAVTQLQTKKQQLLQRQQQAIAAATAALPTNGDNNNNNNDKSKNQQLENDGGGDDDRNNTVGGCVIRTKLDAMEAIESVRYHLDCLQQEEKALQEAEVRLREEKAAHIRALKRVASEDASRFRNRPKLNDRYVLQHLLGKGGFSEVWRAFDLVEFREVAVKIHQLDSRWSDSKKENYTKHVSREYEIHRNVRHQRIVSLYDVFEIDSNSFATVLECCSGKDLELLLKEKGRLPERDARAILLQILSGMQYLSHPSADGSRQGIIHYDLKPGNILFDENGDAKITDFGLSKIVDTPDPAESMELTSQGAGTYWYLPPECFVMEDNVRISNKVDVWSIGVIFYQMLFGKRPFGDGISQDKILVDQTMLNAHEVTFPEKIDISDECKQFLRAALTYDQAFRPSIAQLCANPYVLEKQF